MSMFCEICSVVICSNSIQQLMKMLKFQALSVHADSCSRLLLYSVKHIYTMAGIIAAGWSIKYIG